MASPVRLLLIAFVIAVVIAGGGVLYLDVGNHPMTYYSVTGAFDYRQAIVFALLGGVWLGPSVFCFGLVLYGIGYAFVFGFRLLLNRK